MSTILVKIFTAVLLLLLPQQTIRNIKDSSSEIRGKMSNSIYQQDGLQADSLISILNSDVFGYFHLRNQFNTDARREAYMESQDFKINQSELAGLRSRLISSTFYLDFEPDYQAERSIAIKYDPATKYISVSNDLSYSLFYNDPGYIQLDQFLLKCPEGMSVSKKNINYLCVDVVEETMSFKINDAALASKIEENKYNLKLLFVFNITAAVPVQGKTSVLTASDYHLVTDLRKVIAYNSKTNEIYSVY